MWAGGHEIAQVGNKGEESTDQRHGKNETHKFMEHGNSPLTAL
jgi:hypothetical protein